jgi:hypothetical protein
VTKQTIVLFGGEIEISGSESGTDTDGGSDCGGVDGSSDDGAGVDGGSIADTETDEPCPVCAELAEEVVELTDSLSKAEKQLTLAVRSKVYGETLRRHLAAMVGTLRAFSSLLAFLRLSTG